MINNNKKAFTLAELLISIAIISIISTMGIVISKKGIERAYDYYVFNSYKSLSIAINNAISKCDTINNPSFRETVNNTFGIKNDYSANKLENGVEYELRKIQNSLLLILVKIPSSKKDKTTLAYLYDPINKKYGLIPASETPFTNKLIVLNRLDLLPFVIDDGERGRVIRKISADGNRIELSYTGSYGNKYSYKNAFCKIYNTSYEQNITIPEYGLIKFNINCNDPIEKEEGILKYIDPRRNL